ncbi:thioesterase II family protein [Streptomyces caniferus]|uniref:thioesterase II family protein n=1 Tax=Streptomyces caniferus TaxID=285557 RepID=UPI003824153C
MIENDIRRWFPAAAHENPELRIFCLPHGGGGAAAFRGWQNLAPPGTEIVPVALPGRERRSGEPLMRSIEAMSDALHDPLLKRADGHDFILLGHSMGALLTYELSHALAASGRPPMALVVSGSVPPRRCSVSCPLHRLSDEDFLGHIAALEGTPAGVMDDPELREFLLPVLRADFEACEKYIRDERVLRTPMLIVGGSDDRQVPVDEIEQWAELTTAPAEVKVYSGGHFFLFENAPEVLGDVARFRPWA